MSIGKNAHRLVANIAREMAEEAFELWAKNNAVYAQFEGKKGRIRFVNRVTPMFFEEAREVLGKMLGQPDVSDYLKGEIYEALIQDNMLRSTRLVAKSKASIPALIH